MSNFTFLTDEQIFESDKLDIIKKYGTKAAITDFAILLGGYVSSNSYTSEGNTKKDRTGWWWAKTGYSGTVRVVSLSGNSNWRDVNERDVGARPALPYSLISSISSNGVRGRNEILEVEYGEYPQMVVDEKYSCELEAAYNKGNITITGKNYTTDSVKYEDYNTSFQARTHIEYEYKGERYIRFVGDSNCNGEMLSDGRIINQGDAYWIKVEPIIWMIDESADIALSKKLLFAGVQFKKEMNYKGDFDKTDIKQFMDNNFAKEIVGNRPYTSDLKLDTEELELKGIKTKTKSLWI